MVLAAAVLVLSSASPSPAGELNVATLRVRLHDTPAMGVVTKLSLRREIVVLIDALAAFHAGRSHTDLAALHATFAELVTKTVALLDGADAPLAHDLVASRERIWAELADPTRFAALDRS